MEKYIGTKMIEAKPMNRGEYNKYRGWNIPEDENPEDENPEDEGYLVKYQDGYESWSPKKQFEEAYRDCQGMTFGIALELLKKGLRVAREGWNGKGMFLLYVPSEKYGIIEKIGLGIPKGNLLPWIGMKTADGKFVPWLASQADMLAEDWVIVEESEGK